MKNKKIDLNFEANGQLKQRNVGNFTNSYELLLLIIIWFTCRKERYNSHEYSSHENIKINDNNRFSSIIIFKPDTINIQRFVFYNKKLLSLFDIRI